MRDKTMTEAAHTPLKVLFFGTPDFAACGLKALLKDRRYSVGLVLTQPDKPAGRGGHLRASPVKEIAVMQSIPVFQPHSLRKELKESISLIESHGPFDIGVVIAFGQILPQEILDLPAAGCVNLHASLLPRWRGAAPVQRAIMEGDRESGVCLMKMDAGLDTGPVYSEFLTPLAADETFETLHNRLAAEGAKLLAKDLEAIAAGKIAAVPQPQEGATYARKITSAETHIDWNEPAERVSARIRGLSPFPGAYAVLKGKRIKIFRATAKQRADQTEGGQPGKISFVDRMNLEVECRSGVLSVEELQAEGKKKMPIAEFLKGFPVDRNDFFS